MSQPEVSGTVARGTGILWKTDPGPRRRDTRPLPRRAAEEPVLFNSALVFLKGHGFDGEEAARALRLCGGSREKALAHLQARQTETQRTEPILQEAADKSRLFELAKSYPSNKRALVVQVLHACGFSLSDAKACLVGT